MATNQTVKPIIIDIDKLSELIAAGLKQVLSDMKIRQILSDESFEELAYHLDDKVCQILTRYTEHEDIEPEEPKCQHDITDQTAKHFTVGPMPCFVIGRPCIMAPRGGPQADCPKIPCAELTAYRRQQAREGNHMLLGNEFETLVEDTLTKTQPKENPECESIIKQLDNGLVDYIVTRHGSAVALEELRNR